MSNIQHKEALRLLSILIKGPRGQKPFTYATAAEALGRDPKMNARMAAQVCDLLDAAAAIARVPLFALIKVQEASGKINRKAWVRGVDPEDRAEIIQRSLQYKFVSSDFRAIRRALSDLKGLGNRAAWHRFRIMFPVREERIQLLTGRREYAPTNAIDDIGTDTPPSKLAPTWHYARDPKVRKAVLRRAKGKCELCGKLGFFSSDRSRYLETHHIIALADDGADKLQNVIALCPNEHREAHFGRRRRSLEKEMIRRIKLLGIS